MMNISVESSEQLFDSENEETRKNLNINNIINLFKKLVKNVVLHFQLLRILEKMIIYAKVVDQVTMMTMINLIEL